MVVRDDQPTLCILDAPGVGPGVVRRFERAAQARNWLVRRAACNNADAADEMDEACALVLLAEPCAKDDGETAANAPRRRFPHALLVGAEGDTAADLMLNQHAAPAAVEALLEHAAGHWRRNLKMLELFREVGARQRRLRQLSDIALALSTRRDLGDLLEAILLEARRLAGCDAGSLYLIEEGEPRALVFKLAQNDSVDVPFVESRLPLEPTSVAGYVAVSGQELNIPDVYNLPAIAPYAFNKSFDLQMNYRTRSMLVLPMRDHRDRVVGVLQFINRLEPTLSEPVPFGEEIAELLRAIASQAAISIQKNTLLSDINRLFESFVQASVKTIERRDPSTSGHSFRVAETTVALLEALPKSGVHRFSGLSFGEEHIREVRYAALLHDFGKVGVPERVLLKANKLTDERLELIRFRVELQKERLRRRSLELELDLLHHRALDIEVARRRVHRELERELGLLDAYYEYVVKANHPNLLDDGDFEHLREIRDYGFREFDGNLDGLISDNDLLALSVRRGSLTPEERREIESHVVHTKEFLAVLPWPPELANVAEIAGAHHERLDGTGYPLGMIGEQIPLASRVMAVCDIFDALTAMDRPYKQSLGHEAALSILEDEARRGLLDRDMVGVFISSRVYQRSPLPARRVERAVQGRSQSSSTDSLTR